MPVPLIFAVLIAMVHLAVYFTSSHTHRIIKAWCGAGMAMSGFVCGLTARLITLDGLTLLMLTILTAGLPIASLLIYLPSLWRKDR